MKKLCYFLVLLFTLAACASAGPSTKKHSFDTRDGKKKLQKYNNLYNGSERIYEYRVKKTEKVNKKAKYKAKKP